MKKQRAFFFHYNKPASAKAKEPRVTLHYMGACHILKNIVCSVKTWGRTRRHQPRYVIAGKATNVTIRHGIAYIT